MRLTAEAGDVVAGRYRLESRLGAGGMGVVWLARDEVLDRQVAVKCARPDDERAAARLRTEARNAGRLHHAHIVEVHDFLEEEESCWIVMEYVPARSLAQILADRGTLPPDQAGAIGCQIADALAHSHAAGVVHGDVTPENILVGDDGTAKLTDYGISRAMWSDVTQSRTGGLHGKPRYVPPEVAGGAPADRKSDLFSLGATLFAAVEGHSPYGDLDHPMGYVGRAIGGHIDKPRRAGVLTEVLTVLLDQDPKKRPTAERATQLLLAAVPDARVALGSEAATASWYASLFPRRCRTRRGMLLTSATAAVLVAGAAALGTWGPFAGDGGDGRADAKNNAAAQTRGRPGTFGDLKTADPCSLLDEPDLRRFGETELVTDYGAFARCDVFLVDTDGTHLVDVEAALSDDTVEADANVRTTERGSVTVTEAPAASDECERSIGRGEGPRVWITAERLEPGGPRVCDLADAATDFAVSVLNRGEIPRRPHAFAATSLARVDACGLLDADALRAAVPTIDARDPDPDYARWGCTWSSDGDDGVRVVFDRNGPLDSEDGTPKTLGGHQSFVTPEGEGDGSCLVRTVHRRYTNASGDPTWDLVKFIVYGNHPADQLCERAQKIADAGAERLPTA